MKKLSTLFLILLLCSVLVAIGNIGIVKAQSTIYIRADGSVEGTDKIQQNGDIYTLTGNISVEIQVQKSYIVIDGAGYTLQGDGEIHGPTDVVGMGLRDALFLLENAGLKVIASGRGRVSKQSLRPGTRILPGSTIQIEMVI